ncbi:MAG: type II toxin-antitoxin system VapC family toxin [Acidobacteria bacterium]|nr:type II toxin-antitoxin system VapC family toxin [Acidobacteriota bacterium]
MMFWDSSAVVPLIAPSPQSTTLTDHLAADRGLTVWRGPAVECAAALYRSHREESIGQAALDAALLRLHAFTEDADTVAPGEFVRRRASELVATHRLRAADAFQLAAALAWCEGHPRGERFLSLDDRLRDAARREGFTVLP